MTVTVSKPALNLREELSALKKPSGLVGEQILRANSMVDLYSAIGINKNVLHNASFNVNQRGVFTTATSITTGGNTYLTDRFYHNTTTVSATGNLIINGRDNGRNSIKITATSSATGVIGIGQRLENALAYAGKTMTYSVWVKSNTRHARIYIYSNGTGVRLGSALHSGSGKWEFLTTTFSVPNSSSLTSFDVWTITYDNSSLPVTSGDYIEISEPQLEVGAAATPFEVRSYGSELLLCQRYYSNSFTAGASVANGGTPGYKGVLTAYDGSTLWVPLISYPVHMRATPTITLYNGDTGGGGMWGIYSGGWNTLSSMSPYDMNNKGFYISCTYAGRTAGYSYLTTGNWTANAEMVV